MIDALNTTLEDLGDEGKDDFYGEGYLSKEGIDTYISDKTPIEEVVEEENEKVEEKTDTTEETEDNKETKEPTTEETVEEDTTGATTGEATTEEEEDVFDEEDANQELKTSGLQLTNDVIYIVLDKDTCTNDKDGRDADGNGNPWDDCINFKNLCRKNFRAAGSTWDLPSGVKLPNNAGEVVNTNGQYGEHAFGDLNIDISCTINGWNNTLNVNYNTIIIESGTTTINNCNIVGGTDNLSVHNGAKLILNNCSIMYA